MGLYDQNIISGQETTWRRCNQIISSNPLNGTPLVTFGEEMAVSLASGGTITQPITNLEPLVISLVDTTTSIPLMDFSTGVPVATGSSMTAIELAFALYSAYLYYAQARDAAAAATGGSGSGGASSGGSGSGGSGAID